MNRQTLLSQLAAIEALMGSLRDEPIPEHTERCLWAAMNDVADARTVLWLEQQREERDTGVVTVNGPRQEERI